MPFIREMRIEATTKILLISDTEYMKTLLQTHQDDHYLKKKKMENHKMVRMWRNWNTAFVIGAQNGVAAVESNRMVPQAVKHRIII